MTSSRRVDAYGSTEYAVAASKGFSYYLPKSAQRHLRELLKQLPSAARSIYNEYYRDLMSAKACAPESAAAMASFVKSSFPNIAQKHNTFAREMNKEIDDNEHEGYEPTKFPIVTKPEVIVEEAATVADTGKKGKRARAGSTSLPNQRGKPKKKTRITSDRIPAEISGSPTTAPIPSPDRALRSPAQANSHDARFGPSNTRPSEKDDVQSLISESIKLWGDGPDSRGSSPLSDVPSSSQLSNADDPHEEWGIQPQANNWDPLKGQDDVSVGLIESHGQEDILSPLPEQALLRSIDDLTSVAEKFDAKPRLVSVNKTPGDLRTVPLIPPTTSPLQKPDGSPSAASIILAEGVKGAVDAGASSDSLKISSTPIIQE